MHTVGDQFRPPDVWRQHRSGELSCAYDGGERVFTWPAASVAEMARTWRDSGSPAPDQARPYLNAHRRLEAIVREAGLAPPDTVVFHLGRAQLKALWDDEELVLVIDEIPEGTAVRPEARVGLPARHG